MIEGLVVSFLVSVGLGLASLRLVWPCQVVAWSWPVGGGLAFGLGAGMSALFLFGWMLAFGPSRGVVTAEVGFLILVGVPAVVTVWQRRNTTRPQPLAEPLSGPGVPWWLPPAALLMLGAAAAAYTSTLMQHPHGEWDAWMNWDLKARMFFRGGEGWRAAFSPAIPWSHPDYPVMVPSLVARSWTYAGQETLLGPGVVAGTFTFGTVALLAGALAALRGPAQALLGAIVLLATPIFLIHGTSLYADVPLGFFFLACFVCLALDGRHGETTGRFAVLAGIAAGLSMWTKNEGLLFTLALTGALLLSAWNAGRAATQRRLVAFGAGVAPLFALMVAYKLAYAPPNDLIATLGVDHTLGNLTSPQRYQVTLREYVLHISAFGGNGFGTGTWLLVAYLLGVGVAPSGTDRRWVRTGSFALGLVMLGHFFVFVGMAHELSRLLASSLDRLLLQLWPAALFLFFLLVRAPGSTLVTGQPTPTSDASSREGGAS